MSNLLSADVVAAALFLFVAAALFGAAYKIERKKTLDTLRPHYLDGGRSVQFMRISASFLILFGILRLISASSTTAQLNRDLTAAANEINKKAPVMVDKLSRLDEAKAGNQELILYFTLIDWKKSDINVNIFKKEMEKTLPDNVCSRNAYKSILSRGGMITIQYRSKDQKEVADFLVVPSMCGYKDSDAVAQREMTQRFKEFSAEKETKATN